MESKACWLCNKASVTRDIVVRGGLSSQIQVCDACGFHFFAKDTSKLIADDQLDQTRLKRAGLDIPSVEKDFANGKKQCQSYITDYFTDADKGQSILEIGCSWGYFLDLLREKGAKPYGVEINTLRCEYVNEKLGIECHTTIEPYEKQGKKFKKIFLFYVLEYINDPKSYMQRLVSLLEKGGEIIFITPNLDDVLKDVWKNQGFNNFFYDECAIGYYSPKAVKQLLGDLKAKVDVKDMQGYSFLNHASWHFTNKPSTTGIVGGDKFVDHVAQILGSSEHSELGKELAGIFQEFDKRYKESIERHGFGNRIVSRITN